MTARATDDDGLKSVTKTEAKLRASIASERQSAVCYWTLLSLRCEAMARVFASQHGTTCDCLLTTEWSVTPIDAVHESLIEAASRHTVRAWTSVDDSSWRKYVGATGLKYRGLADACPRASLLLASFFDPSCAARTAVATWAADDGHGRFTLSGSTLPTLTGGVEWSAVANIMQGMSRKKGRFDADVSLDDLLRQRLCDLLLTGAASDNAAAPTAAATAVDAVAIVVEEAAVLHSRDRIPFRLVVAALPQRRDSTTLAPSLRREFIVKADDDAWREYAVMQLQCVIDEACSTVSCRELVDAVAAIHGVARPEEAAPAACPVRVSTFAVTPILQGGADGGSTGLVVEAVAGDTIAALRGTQCGTDPQRYDDVFFEQILRGMVRSTGGYTVLSRFVSTFLGACVSARILAIKDRHNANILLDTASGTFTNVDFSFALGVAPGGSGLFNQESADFKLTPPFVRFLFGADASVKKALKAGGRTSTAVLFSEALVACHAAIKARMDRVVSACCCLPPPAALALSAAARTKKSSAAAAPLLTTIEALEGLWQRIAAKPEAITAGFVDAADHSGTARYDAYQFKNNGVC